MRFDTHDEGTLRSDESAIEQIRKYAPTEKKRQKLEMHRLAFSAKQDKPAYDRKRANLVSSRMWRGVVLNDDSLEATDLS